MSVFTHSHNRGSLLPVRLGLRPAAESETKLLELSAITRPTALARRYWTSFFAEGVSRVEGPARPTLRLQLERLLSPLRRRSNDRLLLGTVAAVACTIRRVIRTLDFRKALHARRVDLGDGVLERSSLDIFGEFAILDLPFKGNQLPLLERLREAGEVAPGVHAMPFGAGFVLALVVLPYPSEQRTLFLRRV